MSQQAIHIALNYASQDKHVVHSQQLYSFVNTAAFLLKICKKKQKQPNKNKPTSPKSTSA